MKPIRFIIIGIITLTSINLMTDTVYANVCGVGDKDFYREIYCEMDMDDTESKDEELIEALSAQFEMDEELIEAILNDTICDIVEDMDSDKQEKLPDSIQEGCLAEGYNNEIALAALTHFEDIRNTYEKEKAIKINRDMMTYKFKASERYWDASLINSPFDLIVDLNLIEIVLFGSKATWKDNVYAFPERSEEEDDSEDIPIDDLTPGGGQANDGGDGTDNDRPDGGFTIEDSNGDGIPDGCVSTDSPGNGFDNPLCGNGTIDAWMTEECDDGNNISGDGCNQYCRLEYNSGGTDTDTEGTSGTDGTDLQCRDPDAITFKNPSTSGTDNGQNGNGSDNGNNGTQTDGDSELDCPPGTFPASIPTIGGEGAGSSRALQQPFEYPGPSVGGTLKLYPGTDRPACRPDETQIQSEGLIAIGHDEPICVKTQQLCADPDAVRTFLATTILATPNWKSLEEDNPIRTSLEAIEATFCVNIHKENRPTSSYPVNEGCIDCHILAIVDKLEEALQTNVTPLENTTSSFGISSAFGPSFSFNLNTATKRIMKYAATTTAQNAIEKVNEANEDSLSKNNPEESSIPTSESPLELIQRRNEEALERHLDILENTRMLTLSSNIISDQETDGRVKPMLIQMRNSFSNIQSKWQAMVQSTEFDEKEQCRP